MAKGQNLTECLKDSNTELATRDQVRDTDFYEGKGPEPWLCAPKG